MCLIICSYSIQGLYIYIYIYASLCKKIMFDEERQCVTWSFGTCKMLLQLESTETNVTTNESEHESLCYYNKYIYNIYLFNKHNGNIWN